ncbi:MAG TPA: transglycosylase domain-containing protein [Kofleriaceae bacterium]|nr:transglycosylase domain-containing protein [Kofleriaceae bacterium]
MTGRRVIIGNRRRGWKLRVAGGVATFLVWSVFASALITAIVLLRMVRAQARGLPDTPDLDAWMAEAPQTSVLVAADGTVLGELPFRDGDLIGHRELVGYDDLPQRLIQAVLAAEDVRYFEHGGIDAAAVVRAALANYQAGQVVEGASTITQQVVRNLLPEQIGRERSMRRKVREALVARKLEQRFSKRRIFEVYVNHSFFGAGAYGVVAAARAYFDKPLDRLDLAETALIAGMVQAPGRTNPLAGPVEQAAARARRDEVLDRMVRAGFVDAGEAEAAKARPIELHPRPQRFGRIAPWDTERARRQLEAAMPAQLARGGLRVELAVQPVLAAEGLARAAAHATRVDRAAPPQVAALLWDHVTGYVEATIGGRAADSQFDRTHQACRQPGSAFKPILYTAAIDRGAITAGTPLRDAPIAEYDPELDVHWKPTNSGRPFRGVALAHEALVASLNAPAVDVLDRVGAEAVADTARALGLTTALADVRPLALGASCVIPAELAGAFAALARGGRPLVRLTIVRVSRGAEVLFDAGAPVDAWLRPARRLDRVAAGLEEGAEPAPVVAPTTAFIVTSMLRDVVRRGTAADARRLGRPAAGKTGTTNHNTDAWFVGFTGRLLAAVWVGYDDPAHTLGSRDDGAHAALPLWMQLVDLAEADRPALPVPGDPPPGMVRARIDSETGLLAAPGAGGSVELWFVDGTQPTQLAGAGGDVPRSLGRASREF